MITTRHKEKSLSQLIKELDTVFSLFIRLRDADGSGTVTCFVTGERVWWKDADAAHFMPRAQMGTRWNEMNVHATSINSNRFDQNHLDEYAEKMIFVYGRLMVDILYQQSHSLWKWTRPEIQEMIEEYKAKVAELRKQKGL